MEQTKLYLFAQKADLKKWSLDHDGPVKHFRYNIYNSAQQICNHNHGFVYEFKESCVKLRRFALMIEDGPTDGLLFENILLGKLIAMLNNSRLKILENNDQSLFATGQLIYSFTDNFLLSSIKMHLAFLEQAGIDEILKKQELVSKMREKVVKLNSREEFLVKYNVSVKTMFKYISKWMHIGCFSLYREEACSLNNKKYEEVPVNLVDLITAWYLLLGLLSLSLLSCVLELSRTKFSVACLGKVL